MSGSESVLNEETILAIICGAVPGVNGIHALGSDMSAAAITKNLLSRENQARGVHLLSGEEGWIIDIYVIVDYGTNIPETAWNVQRRVSESLKAAAADMQTKEINIHVQGVHTP